MKTAKAWVSAARLRTLPLSISGIVVGAALATAKGAFDVTTFWLAILTTIAFQVTSNFANDYGDGIKGTDANDRIGPMRALQSGNLTKNQLFRGILLSISVSVLLTVAVVIQAFGMQQLKLLILFLLFGGFSIWAAIKYTMGDTPYGYQGLGDVFVFLFFGLLGVMGTKFLFTKHLEVLDVFPAIGIGLLCVGVLNLNNLRDMESDKRHGKRTLVVKMGFAAGKKYHYCLLGFSVVSFIVYAIGTAKDIWDASYLIAFTPILWHLATVVKTNDPRLLDKELKKLALSTFFLALTFYITLNYFL